MKYLSRWLKWQNYRLIARYKIRQGGVSVVADTMFALNRSAAAGGERHLTYAYKNKFIQWLYENGYCLAVTEQVQTLYCYSCDGTGEYVPGRICDRCLGDGIYKIIYLYCFVFDIGGTIYVWHQPKTLLRYKVTLTETETRPYDGRMTTKEDVISLDNSRPLLALMDVFLNAHGKDTAVFSYFVGNYPLKRTLIAEMRYGGGRVRREIRRLKMFLSTKFYGHVDAEPDDIPF